jgi:hypothetical protein
MPRQQHANELVSVSSSPTTIIIGNSLSTSSNRTKLLNVIYSIIKRVSMSETALNNVKLLLLITLCYYSLLTTYNVTTGYQSNLMNLFEPYAAIETLKKNASSETSLIQIIRKYLGI